MQTTAQPLLSWDTVPVLVTGASGFIGSHLLQKLRQLGATITAVSHTTQVESDDQCTWVQCDLSDAAAVEKVFNQAKPAVVFHLASQVSGTRELEAVLPMFAANAQSTLNILVNATKHVCRRVVITGSQEEPTFTKDNSIPNSPYAAAKATASLYAEMFYTLYQTPVVNARLFMVYGPSQKDLKKVIPYTILSLLKNESPKFASGKRGIDWIYVEDVVDGLIAAAQSPQAIGKTIDLGTGTLTTTREAITQLAQLMNTQQPLLWDSFPDRPFEVERTANASSTEKLLGWKAKTSLDIGLQKTIEWYTQKFSS